MAERNFRFSTEHTWKDYFVSVEVEDLVYAFKTPKLVYGLASAPSPKPLHYCYWHCVALVLGGIYRQSTKLSTNNGITWIRGNEM